MASDVHRLRKYLRKKRRAKTSKAFDRLARYYWRYHFKVYGRHIQFWNIDTD